MGAYNDELQKAGVFLSAEGLSDASEGFRVDFSSQPPVVTDGPYAEAREIFTGYWLLEVASREEAEHWARKCPLGPGVALEVRRVNEIADFLPDLQGNHGRRIGRARAGMAGRQQLIALGCLESGRVGAHHRIPAAVRVGVSEQPPDGAGQRRVVQGDLPQHTVVPRRIGSRSAVGHDVLGSQGEDHELIDARQILHEIPRVFAVPQPLVHQHRQLVSGLRAQEFETGPPAGSVVTRRHCTSLRAVSDPPPCLEETL